MPLCCSCGGGAGSDSGGGGEVLEAEPIGCGDVGDDSGAVLQAEPIGCGDGNASNAVDNGGPLCWLAAEHSSRVSRL